MVVLGLPKLSDFIVRLFYLRLDYLNALFNLLDYFLNGACRSGNLKRFKQEESKYTVNLVHLVTRCKICAPIIRFILGARIKHNVRIIFEHRLQLFVALLRHMTEAYFDEFALRYLVKVYTKALKVRIFFNTALAYRLLVEQRASLLIKSYNLFFNVLKIRRVLFVNVRIAFFYAFKFEIKFCSFRYITKLRQLTGIRIVINKRYESH